MKAKHSSVQPAMKWLACLILVLAPLAHAATINVNSSQSQATIQGLINGGTPGTDTVLFAAGTYNLSSGFTLKCGLTYTGPVATPATAIMNSTFSQSGSIFNLFSTPVTFVNPCTQATTIEYFKFMNSGGIYVQTSFTNLTIVHNQFGNIPCCATGQSNTGIFVDGAQSTSNTAQILGNTLIQFNTVGDSASCLLPQSAFADTTSESGNGNASACNGMFFNTSINGLTIENNNMVHVSEGIHIGCPGGGHPGGGSPPPNTPSEPCETSQNGVITLNINAQFNDFSGIHRIPWEEQPQQVNNIIFQNNSVHDWISPFFASFGLSLACCGQGTVTIPLNVSNNMLVLNNTPIGRYGYGIEAWGRNAIYDNDYIGVNGAASNGIGYSILGGQINNNTICGSGFATAGYIAIEESFSTGPTTPFAGNSTSTSCPTYPSIAPTISPAAGNATFPLTVTLHDPGYTSGPVPQGNTGIWYTTDGSSPVPGATCTAPCGYLANGGTFSLSGPATVRAVGMWGAANQPTSYPSGFGFTPSAVVSAAYTNSGPPPVLNGITLTCPSSTVQVGSSMQCNAICAYNSGGITYNCNTPDPTGTDASFLSSNTADFVVNGSGAVTGVAAGTANLTASAGSFTSTPVSLAVTAPAPVLNGVYVTCGGVNTLNVGQTQQCDANCTYSGNVTTKCTTIDPYGNVGTGWISSVPGQMTVTSGGLLTAVAAGTPNVKVSAGTFTSNPYIFTISSSPPAATLTGVTVTGANTVTAGQTLTLGAQCGYSDGSFTNCGTTDAHGTTASSWTSATTSVATINSTTGVLTGVLAGSSNITVHAGSFTSPNFLVTVTSATTVTICGNSQVTPGFTLTQASTFPNYFNSVYCVTGPSAGGYNSSSGAFYIPAGTQQLGGLWDLVVIPATSGTAQATSAICKGTYTNTSTTGPAAFVTVAMGMANAPSIACHLAPSTAYWIALVTNQSPGPIAEGFWSCSSGTTLSCAGTLPSFGNGTYPSYFVSNVYGTYTGMTTALTNGGARQASQYIVLNQPPPSLTGGFLQAQPSTVSSITVGITLGFDAYCQYSDGSTNKCTTPDIYGNTVTAWTSSNTSVFTIGAVGSPHPGLVLGISGGNANVGATLTGSVTATPTRITVQTSSNNPVPGSPRVFSR